MVARVKVRDAAARGRSRDPAHRNDAPAGRHESAAAHFRPEIQGLRAVAVLLVATYHIWLGRVSGGVDVFLLLTGFLITGSLLRTADRHGRVRFAAFAGRLARRLLPAVGLVLLAVLAATWAVLPRTRWRDTAVEVIASAFYVENWRLAVTAVDYLAQGNAVSPLQHFWSLGVQGQFYVLWPLPVAGALVIARRRGWSARRVFAAFAAAVFVASLTYSVVRTAADQRWAYFDTAARMWELSLGGLLAVALPAVRVPRRAAIALGWIGLVALVSCGLLLRVSTVFPGYAALWPTGAAVLIIVAGTTGSRFGADRLLTARPLAWVGDLSYPLYLWHWPLLVCYLTLTGRARASLLGGVAVLAGSFVLAVATRRVTAGGFVRAAACAPAPEVRGAEGRAGADRAAGARGTRGRRGTRGALTVAIACVLPPVLVAAGWSVQLDRRARRQQAYVADPRNYPGARALAAGWPVAPRLPVHPDPADAAGDLPVTYRDKCNQNTRDAEAVACVYGSARPRRTIALVGDSHAAHWFPALHEIARAEGWRVVNITKGACPFAAPPHVYLGRPYPSCDEWQEGAMAQVRKHRPDLVVTTATTVTRRGEFLRVSAVRQWRRLVAEGMPVLAIRDTPRLPYRAPECVEERGRDGCAYPKYAGLSRTPPTVALVDPPPGVTFADLSDQLCPAQRCPAVIGNVLVYWDSSHFTATYARTMAPALRAWVRTATGW